MDWTDPQVQQVVVVAVWSILLPAVVWLARKRWPDFDVSEDQKKWLYVISVAAVGAFVSTPGSVGERCVAALVAVVGCQGVFLNARNLGRAIGGAK